MKKAAVLIALTLGVSVWFGYQQSTPIDAPRIATTDPSGQRETLTASPRASEEEHCAKLKSDSAWSELKSIYPSLNESELCAFVLDPSRVSVSFLDVDLEKADRLLQRLFDEHTETNDHLANIPDLRYYLDLNVIESMRGLSEDQLLNKISNERSAEAAYWLAQHYRNDEPSYVMLMLSAASYAQKPGPLLDAINGCCSHTPGDTEGERAAEIRREALIMIAREMKLPEAEGWPEHDLDPEIEGKVLAQRADYVAELNQYSREAFGEEWVK